MSSRDPVESLKHWRKVRDLGHSLQDDTSRESRLRAGIAVLGGSWRIGMSEDEVQGCLSESRLLAQELGRPSAIAASLASYAVHEGMNGRVGKGLGIAEEAVGLINDSLTIDEIFWVECSQAYCFQVAGHVPQCIEACERIARRAGGDPQAGRAIVGFSPLIWAEWVLGWMLAQAGRFDECWRYAERARQWAREHGDQEQLTFALTNTCSAAQEPDSTARLCSSPCSPTPVSLAVTSKPRSARRVKRSTPPMRVAPGFRGALARTVLVDALVLSSAPESEIKAVIAEARELVRKSGGNSLLPRLLEAEARLDGRGDRSTLQAGLRAAEAMYRAMGAPDPADRLIKEMSSSVG